MLKLVLLVAIVVACHPDGGQAQHPAEALDPVGVQHPAPPPVASSPAGVRPPAVDDGSLDAALSGQSDETVAAAKRWVYASFFNRVKRKVAENWHPAAVWRRVDPDGTVYGTATRHTEVRVSLSPGGELVDIDVTVPSGVKELDDEAVRAFRAAAPFASPPERLVQKDGRITFEFSLDFEAGGRVQAVAPAAVK
jgi:TonB family protein